MRRLRKLLLVLAGLGTVVCVLAAHYYYKGFYKWKKRPAASSEAVRLRKAEAARLEGKAADLRKFLAGTGHTYNSKLAFFVDMHLPSGKNRFFVYDLDGDSVRMAGLVSHGSGGRAFSLTPSFSNINGSNCSALGRYRIGGAYMGRFGRAYILHGLDSTNDNALERHIVLHSFSCVPEGETDPYPICNSEGCAMVSPGFLQHLQPMLDASKKPVLLWIFY
ncbi:murein L,D-transpeptidase catalytic domain family protein [Flavitalea sp. BT771]|uniref:murein L,D-transpeptidase catalytic domain-containing protein n=1 Tax=Flavitalea sp. BT771 TaxID=3063329 RepID=UPI0026E32B15|nr:murein L,D-transpeptidase catalytic domain family protein [Flavitalea sp. BT771]MDO6433827.1 murein L,D-transpeptidase catalytic domain family protein [Flavitalea sp. BT771]MDV6222268.1 murein L,D-transpeptidase catalytic domain family protein [Flavitalea sp. BT771]